MSVIVYLLIVVIRLSWHIILDFLLQALLHKFKRYKLLHWILSLDPFHWLIDLIPLQHRLKTQNDEVKNNFWVCIGVDQILHLISIIISSLIFL